MEANGHEAYLVGGCVRDALMGRSPKDYDIATSALPGQVAALFEKTLPTGLKHGTVTVLLNSLPFEVTTFRTDGEYTDHRRPDTVMFSSCLLEDLKRRDFTINAMAFHPMLGLIDPFDGAGDLRKKIIRTVGDPRKRFEEDALRMLRAIRFKARFGFSADSAALGAIREMAATIRYVSRERILAELNGILLSPFPDEMGMVFETGLSKHIFPDTAAVAPEFNRLKLLPEKLSLRWAAVLWETGFREEAALRLFCEHMRMSNALLGDILATFALQLGRLPETAYRLRKTISETRVVIFRDALLLAEVCGQTGSDFRGIRQLLDAVTDQKQCICMNDLAIKGADLVQAGFSPGKALGDLLEVLFICMLQKPELNDRELLLILALQLEKTQFFPNC